MRQMTFEIPEELAERFTSAVPAAEQSGYVTGVLQQRFGHEQRMQEWAASADALNTDPEIAELERDMDLLSGDGLDEHRWEESTSR